MNTKEMIKEATFTSTWDSRVDVKTKCKVNLQTKEVFDIELSRVYGVYALTSEKISFDNTDYPVAHKDTALKGHFWYLRTL